MFGVKNDFDVIYDDTCAAQRLRPIPFLIAPIRITRALHVKLAKFAKYNDPENLFSPFYTHTLD